MFVVSNDPNGIGNGDVSIRTEKGALVVLVYASHADKAGIIASALNAAFSPSHTDLMVAPELMDGGVVPRLEGEARTAADCHQPMDGIDPRDILELVAVARSHHRASA